MKRRRLAYDLEEPPQEVSPGAYASTPRRADSGRRISPTLSAAALAEARNALEAAHTSGDYRYQSIADLLRAAFRAHLTGTALSLEVKAGGRKRHTVELSAELYREYQRLPSRSRGVIL